MDTIEEFLNQLVDLINVPDEAFNASKQEIFNTVRECFTGTEVELAIQQLLIQFQANDLGGDSVEAQANIIKQFYYTKIEEIKSMTENPTKHEFLDMIYSHFEHIVNEVMNRYYGTHPEIKVQKLSDNAQLPTYAHPGDQGADIYAVENTWLAPHTYGNAVHTGIALAIPEGWAVAIRPRSGMSKNTTARLSNCVGTIDAGYRGEIICLFDNIGDDAIEIQAGDRIAQMILEKNYNCDFVEVTNINADGGTERAANGFGSSGN